MPKRRKIDTQRPKAERILVDEPSQQVSKLALWAMMFSVVSAFVSKWFWPIAIPAALLGVAALYHTTATMARGKTVAIFSIVISLSGAVVWRFIIPIFFSF